MRNNEDEELIRKELEAANLGSLNENVGDLLVGLTLEDKDNTINSIPISKFRPNSIQMMEGKLHKNQTKLAIPEIEEVKEQESSPIRFGEAIRLSNICTLKSVLEEGFEKKLENAD